jgi:esterase/lipase
VSKEAESFVFVFVHGYGTSILDFGGLPDALHEDGFDTAIVKLPGHESYDAPFIDPDLGEYEAAVKSKIEKHIKNETKIVLVGFSLGATIATKICRTCPEIFAVILISTFLGLPPLRERLLKLANFLPVGKDFKRRVAVTRSDQCRKLKFSERLSIAGTLKVSAYAEKIRNSEQRLPEKTLFLHSANDKVADYAHVAHFSVSGRAIPEFISFQGLNHYLVHDLGVLELKEVVVGFVCGVPNAPETDHELQIAQYNQLNEEHRFWANRVFQLIVGFFTVFGFLVFNSLSSVLEREPSAPYFLLSYTSVSSIYVIITALYYFFMMRTQVYIVGFIEPLIKIVGFQQYKINRSISGAMSSSMSVVSSIVIIVLPMLIALISLVEVFRSYSSQLVLSVDNALLIVWTVFSVFLFIFGVVILQKLGRYGRQMVYSQLYPRQISDELSVAVSRLLLSVRI